MEKFKGWDHSGFHVGWWERKIEAHDRKNLEGLLSYNRYTDESARRLGLVTIGVFGVLLEAKRKALIDRVLPCVDRLVSELRFFVSPGPRSP